MKSCMVGYMAKLQYIQLIISKKYYKFVLQNHSRNCMTLKHRTQCRGFRRLHSIRPII
jgi:hypothetical protein